MQRGPWRSMSAMGLAVAIGVLLVACGSSAPVTATSRAASGTFSPFVVATLRSGPTATGGPSQPPNTLAPRPTTFPTSTPIPRVGSTTAGTTAPRASGTASTLPTGVSTSAAMNGMRTFTNLTAAYQLTYPAMWSITTQSSTVTISPETGSTRIAGFLIEAVRNPQISPEDDLKEAVMPSGSTMSAYTATSMIAPVTVAGEPGFRVDVRISLGGSSSRGSATAAGVVYTGSIITTSHKGVNYRIGLFAHEGDMMTLMQAEQVLMSLRFT